MATSKPSTKRKAASQPQEPSSKHQKKGDRVPIFRLFDLPAELRNIIYEEIALTSTATVKKRKTTDTSGLLAVDDTPAEEYLPILLLHAERFEIDVINFDFSHVITFINRLSKNEMKSLPSVSESGVRKIEIQLRITSPPTDKVDRWLNRVGHTTKKGMMLKFEYEVVDVSQVGNGWLYARKAPNLASEWREYLMSRHHRIQGPQPQTRQGWEAQKIMLALWKASYYF